MENKENIIPEGQDTSQKSSQKPSPKKSGFRLNFHIIIIAFILIIAGISVYRLVKWNQGTQLDSDMEDIDSSEFDIETLDMILPMDASLLEGHEDDGETHILCIGNNAFADDRSENGLAARIASRTGATVYDCSFPDSSAACKYSVYNPEYPNDHFNFYYVIECLRNQEFTAIGSIAGSTGDYRYTEAVSVMESLNMDKIDIMLIMYDSTDYNQGTPSDNPDSPYDVTAFTGGIRTTLKNIKATWPHIRIFVMSPTYAQYQDENGELHSGTRYDIGHGTLNHYLVKELEATMDCGVSFIDNYFGTINEDNYKDYMLDHMHYNNAGRDMLADRIADIVNNRLSVVNSVPAK